jgi:hypothetical protein
MCLCKMPASLPFQLHLNGRSLVLQCYFMCVLSLAYISNAVLGQIDHRNALSCCLLTIESSAELKCILQNALHTWCDCFDKWPTLSWRHWCGPGFISFLCFSHILKHEKWVPTPLLSLNLAFLLTCFEFLVCKYKQFCSMKMEQ